MFRVAEPAEPAHRLRPSANGVTDQGLGEVTSEARNGAGNPVLADGQSPAGLPGRQTRLYPTSLVIDTMSLETYLPFYEPHR